MIAIIDYGMGNLRSVHKAFEKLGFPARVTNEADEIRSARGVVLPGVGAFGDAMKNLKREGLLEPILEAVTQGKPFLGICLGMQLLFSGSEENGWHEGLNLLPGIVQRLPAGLKVPHMGWNQLDIQRDNPIVAGIPQASAFYFVHSYYVPAKEQDFIVAITDYGVPIAAVVSQGNVFGLQFHPEKSSRLGLSLLKNFGGMVQSDRNSSY
ncbi:MAG: imidazole glycerol phosphate synthase subunit HisH [Firmicutes bacterium]|nr:imidazole glycerol phosphate synthase subunit HisH [Bacillota bacterium]